LVVAAAGSLLVLAFFLFVDLGGTFTGTVHATSLVAAVVWAGPFWVYARMVRTRAISLCGGAALLAATTALLVVLFRDTHSTAGIGIATIPMFLYPLTAGALAIDRLLFARHTGEPLLRGFALRLLAAGMSFVVVVAAIFTVIGVVGLFDPVTRNDLAGSLITTVVCAATTAGGALAIKRLWRTPPPSRAQDHYAP